VIRIRYGRATDVGMVRTENQDSMGVLPEGAVAVGDDGAVLFVVADGMGGHRAGRHASELAVSTILASFANNKAEPVPTALTAALGEANRRIFEEGSSTPAYNGMGTTCTALALQGTSAWVAHIGDSKAFLVTSETITQITTDHSRVWELYRRGIITREQARVHPERNLLTRALGQNPDAAADVTGPLQLQLGTWFVLCTDGLTNHVEEGDIRKAIAHKPPEEAVTELVELAKARGGTDNITVQIIEILGA
jgi:serine/threonine protein phosphatase PrpC